MQQTVRVGKKYIEETKRTLNTKLSEHQAAARRGELEKSAIAEHAWTEEHKLNWVSARIIEHNKTLLIKNAVYTQVAGEGAGHKEKMDVFARKQREAQQSNWYGIINEPPCVGSTTA